MNQRSSGAKGYHGVLGGTRPTSDALLAARALMAGILGLLAGCASVEVHKLNASGGIDKDAPEGIRYYLPRPYVSVTEPFVIATKVYLCAGEVSPDGKYVLVTDIPQALIDDKLISVNPNLLNAKQTTMGAVAIDSGQVVWAGPGGPQGAPAGQGESTAKGGTPASPSAGGSTTTGGKTDEAQAAKPGTSEEKTTSDSQAFAVTPLPRYFTILWLPDYSEQYVISTKHGVGTATATINLAQGWSLQGLDAKIDNSAIIKPLMDFYSASVGAVEKLATAKIEGPLALLRGIGPQGAPAGAGAAKSQYQAGTKVSLKLTVARVVAPGVYRILKPAEIAALKDFKPRDDVLEPHLLLPQPPLTDVAFNSYDVLVVEALQPAGDSAFSLGQATPPSSAGVKAGGSEPPADNKPTAGQDADLTPAVSALNAELSKPDMMTIKGVYYQSSAKRNSQTNAVTISLATSNGGTGGKASALPTKQTLTSLAVSTFKSKGVTVDAKNVTVK